MKQKFSKLLPDAVAAIRQEFGIRNDDGSYVVTKEIPREYQGYISSFGASVMQMGLTTDVGRLRESERRRWLGRRPISFTQCAPRGSYR